MHSRLMSLFDWKMLRVSRGLDTQLDSIDVRLNAHQVYLGKQSEQELESLIRSQLEPKARAKQNNRN